MDQQLVERQRTLQLILIVSAINERGVRRMEKMEFVAMEN